MTSLTDLKRPLCVRQPSPGTCYTPQILDADGGILAEMTHYGRMREDAEAFVAAINAFPDICARLESAERCATRLAELYSQLPGVRDVDERLQAWRQTVKESE